MREPAVLILPKEDPSTIRTIGIDPGTTHLGISVMEINLETFLISNTYAFTLNGDKLANSQILSEHYGNKYSRISGMMKAISRILEFINPTFISSEAPFFNPTRPIAFEALVEVISHLRETIFQYDPQIKLNLVDPSSVKNAVGAKGGANKVTIKEALSQISSIHYRADTRFEDFDEHSIDSIAVNYWYYLKHILKGIQCDHVRHYRFPIKA